MRPLLTTLLRYRRALPQPPRPARRHGITLVEVMPVSAILGITVAMSFSGIIFVQQMSYRNSLRAVALFTAEQTLEQLRALGHQRLSAFLVYNGVPDNSMIDAWEANAIALGIIPGELPLTRHYTRASTQLLWQEIPSRRQYLRQSVLLVSQGDPSGPTERVIGVFVDVQWQAEGYVYRDSLFTIID